MNMHLLEQRHTSIVSPTVAVFPIVQNHSGFDIEGNVRHEVQAAGSVRDLAMYLQIMRGLREKIDEVPGVVKRRIG